MSKKNKQKSAKQSLILASDYEKQKLDKKNLALAIDYLSDNSVIALQNLIRRSGKSESELFEEIIYDDEVEACREDIRAALLAEKWNLSSSIDENLVNRLWLMLENIIEDLAELAVLAKLHGYSVGEYIFEPEPDGFLRLSKILNKFGELDKYEPKYNGELVFSGDSGEISLNTDYKFLFLSSKASPFYPKGEMMLIRAYPAILLRRKSWAYAGQFIERYSQPFILGKQGGYGDIQDFAKTLQGLSKGGIAGIGSDDEVNVNQLSGDASPFEVIEKIANSRIQKLILGKTRTGDLDNGSKAAQETEENARRARISAYLNLMRKAVQHAINATIAVNNSWGLSFGAEPVLFDYQTLENVDLVKAQRDQIYINAGLELDKSYFVEALGYEERHIKGFKTVSSEQLAVSSLRSAATPLGSYKHSLQLADKPKTALEEDSEEITAEDKQALNAIQKALNDCLKDLGFSFLGD